MTLLSYVVPARDEEAAVPALLDAATASADALVAAGTVGAVEVVVVDDGSTDGTAALVTARAATDPRVRLVTSTGPPGLGGAVRAGLAAATGDVVLYTDADLPFDLAVVPDLIELQRADDADLVCAYRRSRRGEGARRWVYSYVYNSLVRTVLGVRVRDVNFAGKLLTRPVVDAVTLRSQGSFIDAELLGQARARGFTVAQLPIDYRPRSQGTSTLSSPTTIVTMVREMASLARPIRAGR